jgi:hypothetical protein
VFTRNGHRELLSGPRVGPLATRRAARDFNPQVENDLFFWLWVLTAGEGIAFIDDGAVSIRPGFVSCDVVDAPSPIGAGEQGEGNEVPDDGLEETDELTEEIAAIAADFNDEDA